MAEFKIFLGYASGVGKTTVMLEEALSKGNKYKDIIIGWMNTHDDQEMKDRMSAFYNIVPRVINQHYEFDLDTALQRHPDLILIDDIAHTNAEGSRHQNRLQDVEELLNAGISVYTTLNIQDVESMQDIVVEITKQRSQSLVSDRVFDLATQVQLIDIDVDELAERTRHHRIYSNLLSKTQLTLLRELALRKTTERIQIKTASLIHEKVGVLISLHEDGKSAIRKGALQAKALSIPLVVLFYYDSTYDFTKEEHQKISLLKEYTKSMDGEFVEIATKNLFERLSVILEEEQINQLILTSSRGISRIKQLYLMSRLMKKSDNLEVHFVQEVKSLPRMRVRKGHHPSVLRDWLRTLLIIGMTYFVALALKHVEAGEVNSILVFLVGIMVIARFTSSYRYSILASFINVFIITVFFVEPYLSFAVSFQKYPLLFFIMLLSAMSMSTLNIRNRKEMERAIDREKKTNTLYHINQGLLENQSIGDALLFVAESIKQLYQQSVVIFYEGQPNEVKSLLSHQQADFNDEEVSVLREWVKLNAKPAGYGTLTFSHLNVYALPIVSKDTVLGVVCVSGHYPRLENDDFSFLKLIVAQLSMVLERAHMRRQQQQFLMESQRENLRSDLLRSISHDLRTPLTSIYGSSSALLEDKEVSEAVKERLLTNIQEDAQWLIRMIENILTITRFSDKQEAITKKDEMVEEVVGEAISRVKQRFSHQLIEVHIPSEVIFIKMDGLLIEQVIINLVENAIKHSKTDQVISLLVQMDHDEVFFMVEDHGEGIEVNRLKTLFDQNKQPLSTDISRGLGIGLSLCMTIVKAHDGRMWAENKEDGGARFTFTLPR